MGALTLGLMAAGTALSAVGAYQQAEAQNAANQAGAENARLQAKTAAENADFARRQAQQERENAQYEATQKGKQLRALAASGLTRQLAGGVTAGGSVSDVYASNLAEADLDMWQILANGSRQAAQYEQNAANYRNQGAGLEAQASAAESMYVNPWLPAATALVAGGTQIAQAKYGMATSTRSLRG